MKQKVAVPVSQGALSSHFGHCEMFAYYEIEDDKITSKALLVPPVHEPGSHPLFLKEKGCDTIITGGMGIKARDLFKQYGIRVIVGAEVQSADEIIAKYLQGSLKTGMNMCDH